MSGLLRVGRPGAAGWAATARGKRRARRQAAAAATLAPEQFCTILQTYEPGCAAGGTVLLAWCARGSLGRTAALPRCRSAAPPLQKQRHRIS